MVYSFFWVIPRRLNFSHPSSETPPPMKNIRVDPSLRTDSLGLFKYYITTQDYAYILSTTGEKLMPTKLVSP